MSRLSRWLNKTFGIPETRIRLDETTKDIVLVKAQTALEKAGADAALTEAVLQILKASL